MIRTTAKKVLRRAFRKVNHLTTKYGINLQEVIAPQNEATLPMKAFYAHFIKPKDLCFDVGANTGNRSDIFLSLGARVICVEPQPALAAKLRRKYRGNSSATVVAEGCAAKTGTLSLSLCGAADTIATFSDKWKTGRFHTYTWDNTAVVPVTTLDDLIARYGDPGFCKIDVEGFEHEVLQGLSKPIRCISFEYTNEFFDDAKCCLEVLAKNGPIVCNYTIGETPFFIRTTWDEPAKVVDDILLRDDPELWGDIYVRSV